MNRNPTWAELAVAEPQLIRFETEAREAARNGWQDWPAWLRTSSDFNHLFGPRATAEALRGEAAHSLPFALDQRRYWEVSKP